MPTQRYSDAVIVSASCPSEDKLVRFIQAELAPEQHQELEQHVDRCSECAAVVGMWAKIFSLRQSDSREPTPPSASVVSEGHSTDSRPLLSLLAGKLIGRYRILAPVGAGGMGVVYSAWDPELDRRVAIKVLRPTLERSQSQRQVRLQREAQALARLSHPNVIAVHDVGVADGQVFVAMEFIEGCSLARWLREQPRSWPEIRTVFMAAGEGLAAAHAAGLTHRDFKPDNVLISRDGRVRVTDFGLARVDATDNVDAPVGRAHQPQPDNVTREGVIVGTPAYMAPEQLAGRRVGPLADQYAFCIALFEAITGTRPFAARSLAQLAAAIATQTPRFTPRVKISPRVRRAVLRGLSREPSDRFADLRELLEALAPRHTRWRWTAVTLGVAVASFGAAMTFAAPPSEPSNQECADTWLADTWNPERAQQVKQSFADTGLPFAQAIEATVTRRLEANVGALKHVRATVCDAEISAMPPDLTRMAFDCLDDRQRELTAVVDVLGKADKDVVRDAIAIVDVVGAPQICLDVSDLRSRPPVVADPRRAAEIRDTRAELARSDAALAAGRPAESREILDAQGATVERVGWQPLRAQWLIRRGRVADILNQDTEGREMLYEAVASATRGSDRRAAAEAWIELIYALGKNESAFEAAHVAAAQAQAEIDALGGLPNLEAARLANLGTLMVSQGRYTEALDHYERALALRQQLGQDSRVNDMRFNIATVHSIAGDRNAAEATLRELLDSMSAQFGADHPEVADVQQNLGMLLTWNGEYEEALSLLRHAAQTREQTTGPDSEALASAIGAIADILDDTGRPQEALGYSLRALDISRARVGDDSPQLAVRYIQVAEIYLTLVRWNDARSMARRAVELAETRGREHPTVADALAVLSQVDLEQGTVTDTTVAQLRRAVSIGRAVEGELLNSTLSDILLGRALAMRQDPEGLAILKDAVKKADAGPNPGVREMAHLALADALWDKRRFGEAIDVVRALLSSDDSESGDVDQVHRWLAEHPPAT